MLRIISLSMLCCIALQACDSSPGNDPGVPGDQSVADSSTMDQGNAADIMMADIGPDAGQDAVVDMGPDARIPIVPDELPTEGSLMEPRPSDLTEAVVPGRARASRVDDDAERLRGPEANCRIGDYRLDNAIINVCIQAETTFSQFSFSGGNIIDAHRADRPGTDSLREIVIAPSIGEVSVDEVGVLKDGADGGLAIIRTTGIADGARIIQGVLPNAFLPPPIQVITEYQLAPDSDVVAVKSWIQLTEDTSAQLRMLDLVYFGDLNRDFKPGYGPETVNQPLDYVAAIGPDNSYGWFTEEGSFSLFVLAVVGVPGAPVQYDPVIIRTGDIVLFRRSLRIGTGDVESIRPRPENGQVVSITGAAGTQVIIEKPDESVVTDVKLDADGMGTVHLIAGEYNAHTHAFAGGDIDEPFTVGDDAVALDLAQPLPAELHVSITDQDGSPLAARVQLVGPTNILRFVVDEETMAIPAGMWALTVTRGWHYSIHTQAIEVVAGGSTDITVVLTEQIPLEGLASGEFHQHASPSLDSEVSVSDRILSNLVEGVSFMVPSDHDIIYDYGAQLIRMGLDNRLSAPLTGQEISPLYTHMGAYGMTYDPYAGAGGAILIPVKEAGEWRVRTVPELIEDARDRGARAIQINHPRASQGYFDHVEYHAHVPIDALDTTEFSPDFDSIEVYNGGSEFCQVLNDWMGLLNQGHRSTAVGNSDTHSRDRAPGYPRNYLPTLAADPIQVTADEIISSLVEGTLTVGGDAMMDFPGEYRPGQTIEVDAESIDIHVRVRTPSYTSVNRLFVFVNGVVVEERAIESPLASIVDIDEAITVAIDRDAHIEFLAVGDERSPESTSRSIFAFSNPIWVDFDGDGITPMGPSELPFVNLPFCRQ